VDIFAGYSYLGTQSKLQPGGIQYTSISLGAAGSGAFFFNKHLGVEILYTNHVVNGKAPSDGAVGISGGPIYRKAFGNNLSAFAHGLFGVEQLTGPNTSYPPAFVESERGTWGIGMTLGGGLDLNLCKRVSLRLIEADYRYSHVNFGTYAGVPIAPPYPLGGTADLNALELSTGIVTHFGGL
jgi:opacity protein-like surface antigen